MTLSVNIISSWKGTADLSPESAKEAEIVGISPTAMLVASIETSTTAYVIRWRGVPLAWFGYYIGSYMPSSGIIWMLSSSDLRAHKFLAARGAIRVLTGLFEIVPRLTCIVDTEYTNAWEWLNWLGFSEGRREGRALEMILERKDWKWAG